MAIAMIAALVIVIAIAVPIAMMVPIVGTMPAGAGVIIAGCQRRAGNEQGTSGKNSSTYHEETPFRS